MDGEYFVGMMYCCFAMWAGYPEAGASHSAGRAGVAEKRGVFD